MMNTRCFLFALLLCLSLCGGAQQPCGIYRTVEDFSNNRITLSGDGQFGKRTIQISDFFLRPYVTIRTGSEKIKVHQDSLYAVVDFRGNCYRIWQQRAYLVLEQGGVTIYSRKYTKTVRRRTSRSLRFVQEEAIAYYFSMYDHSEIIPLTFTNVVLAFVADNRIDKRIQQKFLENEDQWRTPVDLLNINSFLKERIK